MYKIFKLNNQQIMNLLEISPSQAMEIGRLCNGVTSIIPSIDPHSPNKYPSFKKMSFRDRLNSTWSNNPRNNSFLMAINDILNGAGIKIATLKDGTKVQYVDRGDKPTVAHFMQDDYILNVNELFQKYGLKESFSEKEMLEVLYEQISLNEDPI